jgi:hypothetical protein
MSIERFIFGAAALALVLAMSLAWLLIYFR